MPANVKVRSSKRPVLAFSIGLMAVMLTTACGDSRAAKQRETIERQKALMQGFSREQERTPMKEMPPVGGWVKENAN